MPKPRHPTRRRNARTAYECGAERSDFGRRGGDAQPRLRLACGAAAAERSPERRVPESDDNRRSSGGRSPPPRFHAFPNVCASPIRSLGVADVVRPPRRKFIGKARARLAVSCSTLARPIPIWLEIARVGRADPRPASPDGQRRGLPRRRRRAAQRTEDQNESGDCGAPARQLMSAWRNCCARRRATQGGGRPDSTGRATDVGAVPASKR